jgi:hypothetical protein
MNTLRAVSFGLVFLAGCSAAPPPEPQPGCNPLVGDDCLTPFPSAYYQVADASSATGFRVHIADDALPTANSGIRIKPDRLNQKDGFSPSTPFIVYFKAGIDATMVPGSDNLAPSLTAEGPVQVLDFETGERVPAFAEVDGNAQDAERKGLIIRPARRLAPGKRYIIALSGLRDRSGKLLAPAPFVALRDRTALSAALKPLAAHQEEIFAVLTKAGVARDTLTLAWDVVTGSDANSTSHLVDMRDQALSMSAQFGYTITNATDTPSDPLVFRRIHATVRVPTFLTDETPNANLVVDATGAPQLRTIVDVPIIIQIPACALKAQAPLPTVVFGHGLFGSAEGHLAAGPLEQLSQDMCAVFIGTDWIGLSTKDVAAVGNALAVDLNGVYIVTDRLQQAHVNAQVMTRTFLTQIKDDPALAVNGHPLTDGHEAYYLGVSLGGIEGGTFMALSPDVVRGVLNVPGSTWSLLIFRSTDFGLLKPILEGSLPDPLDRQIAIGLTQSEWDYTDPASFASHLLANPLKSVMPKRILVQESIGDAEVSNVATRLLARTIGLTGLRLTQPVLGIDEQTGPLDSAYTQWDSQPAMLPPLDNQALRKDNGAHEAVYRDPGAQAQIRAFLRPDGQVTDVCHDKCVITN